MTHIRGVGMPGHVSGQEMRGGMSFFNSAERRAFSGEHPPTKVSLHIPAGPWKGESKHCKQTCRKGQGWAGTREAKAGDHVLTAPSTHSD